MPIDQWHGKPYYVCTKHCLHLQMSVIHSVQSQGLTADVWTSPSICLLQACIGIDRPYLIPKSLISSTLITSSMVTYRVSKRSDDPPINVQTSGQMICQFLSCVYLPVVSTYLWAPTFIFSRLRYAVSFDQNVKEDMFSST